MLLDENIKPDIQSAPLLVGFNHGFQRRASGQEIVLPAAMI